MCRSPGACAGCQICGGGEVSLWHIRTGRHSRYGHGYVGPILCVALDPIAHTPGPARGQVRRVVRPHDERVIGRERQVIREGCRLVDIVPSEQVR